MSANPYEEHKLLCTTAIENTAARLGVDPVAFAEACQDGGFLDHAILLARSTGPIFGRPALRKAFERKFAALKRAEPQS